MPNVEDFGISAVEAQAAGRPVVAAGSGGALETIKDGETGVHFPPEDEHALAEILRETDFDRFAQERLVEHAQVFSEQRFRAQFLTVVNAALKAA